MNDTENPLRYAERIVMIRSYGGFKRKAKAEVRKVGGEYVAYFGRNKKPERWIRTVLKHKLAKIVIRVDEKNIERQKKGI